MQTVELFNDTKGLIEVQIDHAHGCKAVGHCHCKAGRMRTIYLAPHEWTAVPAIVLVLPQTKALLKAGDIHERTARPFPSAVAVQPTTTTTTTTSGRRAAKGKE